MADYNMGTARGRIRTEYDNSGVTKAEKSFDSLNKSSSSLNKGFKTIAATSGTATLAVAGGLAYAATKAIDFEKQISAIGAVSGASTQQMESLRKKALQLGADTAFSASQSANAMEELAKAGVSVEDILNGAADAAVALAAAGGVELPLAAEIAANALGQFNLQAKDLAKVVDLIAGAANASAISVEDFNESMKQAGAVANLAGVSFEDLAVAIALMGRNGIKGSDAGTSLKTMLSNLQPTTKKQADEFKRLGLITKEGSNTFFDARGNLKSLADVSGILAKATKNMTAQQKQATLELLFGSDAIRAAAILTKNGAAGFNEMATAMKSISAADVAKKRLDNVAGSIEQLKGSLETAAISIGTALLPAIRLVTEFITKLVNKFSALDPRWQKLIAFALVAAVALGALVTAIAVIGTVITAAGAAIATLASGGIVAAVIAGIAAIVAAFVILWKRSEAFRSAIQTIFAVISDHVKKMRAVVQPFVDFVRNQLIPILANGFKKAIDSLRPAFEAVSKFMREKVSPALAELRAALTAAMPTIIKVARVIGQALANSMVVVGKVISFLVPLLLKVAGFIFPLLIKVISFLIRNIPAFVSAIKTISKVLFTIGKIIAIAVIAPLYAMFKAGQFVFNVLRAVVTGFVNFWKAIWGFIGPVVVTAFNLVKSVIQTVIAVITAIISVFWTVAKAIFQAGAAVIGAIVGTVFGAIRNVITAVMGFLAPYLQAIWNFILGVIVPVAKSIWDFIVKAFNGIKAVASIVWNALSTLISTVWNKIKSIVQTGVQAIINVMNGIKKMVDNVKAFFNQLKAAADGGVGSLIAFVKQIPGKIVDALGNVGSILYDKGKQIIQGLINGIKAMFDKLRGVVSDAMDIVGRFLPGSPAKEGPLSGRGYVKIRGEHLTEDFAAGIIGNASAVEAAIASLVGSIGSDLPATGTGAAVAAASTTAGGGTVLRRTIPAPAPAPALPPIENLNIYGVWDFSDPLAERKVAARVDRALTDYRKGYR